MSSVIGEAIEPLTKKRPWKYMPGVSTKQGETRLVLASAAAEPPKGSISSKMAEDYDHSRTCGAAKALAHSS